MSNLTPELMKRYFFSTLITFTAGFAFIVTPELNDLTYASLSDGALFGLVMTGVRGGVKALFEMSQNSGAGM